MGVLEENKSRVWLNMLFSMPSARAREEWPIKDPVVLYLISYQFLFSGPSNFGLLSELFSL